MPQIIIGFAVILVIALIIYVWKIRSSQLAPAAVSPVQQAPIQQTPVQQAPVQQQPLPLIPSITPLPPMPTTPAPMPVVQPTIAVAPPAPAPIYSMPVAPQPVEEPVAAPPAITVLPHSPTIYTMPVAQPVAQPAPEPAPVDPNTLTKFIKVSKSSTTYKNDDDSFQLAELVIQSANGQISAADIQSVTSSPSAYGSNPKMIVDGNTNGSYFAMTSWHSDNISVPRWIMVTLVNPMKISSVKVYNRTDCCWDRLNGAKLELINQYNKPVNSVNLSGALVQNYTF